MSVLMQFGDATRQHTLALVAACSHSEAAEEAARGELEASSSLQADGGEKKW
jgi:hypothetical protein